MSISTLIDRRHRLTPRDLGHRDHLVTIRNVSWQGLETLTPLLHLQEFPTKWFALDAEQHQTIVRLLGTHHTDDWIGCQLFIAAQSDRDQLRIYLFAPQEPSQRGHKALIPQEIHIPESISATFILLLILFALFLLVALLDQSDGFWQWLAR